MLACLALTWRLIGPRNLVGAFALCLLPTSWAFCVKHAITVRLPARYFELRKWERGGRLYEALGVRRFQRLLRTPLLRILNLDITRRFSQRNYAEADQEMRHAETSHVLAFFVAFGVTILVFARRWWDALAYLTLFNTLVNAYPIMLQRYNRVRLERLALKLRSGSSERMG